VTYCSTAPPDFKQQLLSRLAGSASFDPRLDAYGALLRRHVRPPQVDYRTLKADRAALDAVARSFGAVAGTEEQQWPREQRIAYWINAYNLFTLQAIVDHYPIASRWFTLQPRNSIRQIDGVWTKLTWQAAGRAITLDGIEHGILRPEFGDPRIHFAINCASIGCPPLAEEPYRAVDLNAQLDAAARRYLASPQGLRLDGDTIRVSSIFKWYGQDFTQRFSALGASRTDPIERAILGVVAQFGPAEAAAAARSSRARVGFLDYDWSLNDVR
jgi:hypothetical protein